MQAYKINIEWNSSSHRINGDFHLKLSDKIMRFVRNFFDNVFFSNYQVDILKFSQDVRIINKTLLDDANAPSRNRFFKQPDTFVGERALIGANCLILPGIRIGVGPRIGAGSVVTKDLNDHTEVFRNPARPRS